MEGGKYQSPIAIHSGKTLLENIKFIGMSQRELASKTEIPLNTIELIIKGRASITPRVALKLEKVLGVKASFWNNLDLNYRTTLAKIKNSKKKA